MDEKNEKKMSEDSHWYINDIQLQQIIDTPRTPIEEVDVLNDITVPKKDRVEHAGKILERRYTTRVIKELSKELGICYEGAEYMLEGSFYPKLVKKIPEYVMHYSANYWSDKIADRYFVELEEMEARNE